MATTGVTLELPSVSALATPLVESFELFLVLFRAAMFTTVLVWQSPSGRTELLDPCLPVFRAPTVTTLLSLAMSARAESLPASRQQ
mmetsp:Transcript_67691/g.140350  ORF Transcript_67691/g.140350 Transcript_67691/m.140350 type:complete len:86 (+) Transcript_67691:681-938(+)